MYNNYTYLVVHFVVYLRYASFVLVKQSIVDCSNYIMHPDRNLEDNHLPILA